MTERSLTSSALAALGRENPPPSRLFDQMKVSEASTGVGERLTLDRTLGEVEHTSPKDNDSKCTYLRSSCLFTTRWTLLPMWRANASVLRGSVKWSLKFCDCIRSFHEQQWAVLGSVCLSVSISPYLLYICLALHISLYLYLVELMCVCVCGATSCSNSAAFAVFCTYSACDEMDSGSMRKWSRTCVYFTLHHWVYWSALGSQWRNWKSAGVWRLVRWAW